MFGGETPTERSAEVIIEWFGPSAVAAGMSRFFIIRSTPERAREVTQAAADLAPESVCALSLAADVAMHVECNHRRASSLIDRALALTEDDRDRVVLADYLLRLGRASDALAIVDKLHLDDPEDDHLEAIRANGLILAWQRATAEPGDEHIPDECPCWSGRPWAECCQPAERKAIR